MSRRFRFIPVMLLLCIATISSAQDSSAMHLISRIPSNGVPSDVYTNSEVGYLCSRTASILIADLTNPLIPRVAANFPLGSSWANHCNVGYAVCMVANGYDGVRALDMSDFNVPAQLSLFPVGAFASDLVYYPPYVYVATYERGLVIVNASNLSQPIISGSCSAEGAAFSVVVRDNLAYVAANGLTIMNVQYPVAPSVVGRVPITGTAYKVALFGNYCYVANGSSGVQIVNVANSNSPFVASTIPNRGLANHVEILDDHLYVSYYGSGVAIYNLQDTLHPHIIGWYNNGGYVHAITAWSHYALASNTNGFYNIFDCTSALDVPGRVAGSLPSSAGLTAYPNPFNATTTIEYSLPKSGQVELKLYDLTGREVRSLVNLSQHPGTYRISLDASELASGNYFCQLRAGAFIQTRKLNLVK